jgi:hypothetical protein
MHTEFNMILFLRPRNLTLVHQLSPRTNSLYRIASRCGDIPANRIRFWKSCGVQEYIQISQWTSDHRFAGYRLRSVSEVCLTLESYSDPGLDGFSRTDPLYSIDTTTYIRKFHGLGELRRFLLNLKGSDGPCVSSRVNVKIPASQNSGQILNVVL